MEKQRKLKVVILSTLIIGILTLTIAFSALSRSLNIDGVGKMDTALWDVHFENLSDVTITRDAVEINKPNISLDKGTVENINVKLTKPKDEIKYVVDIVNKGTIKAEVNVMTISDLTDEEKKLIDFGVYYLNGSKIVKYDVLEPADVKSIVIKIRYKDDITEFDLPSEPLEIKLSCQIEYVQSNSEIVITPNESLENVTSVLARGSLGSSTSTFFNGTIKKETIESISFLSTLNVPQNSKLTAWDASLNKDGSVVAWYTDIDNNDLYELYIGGNGKVYAPENSSALFYEFNKVKEINFNNNFDTSNVVDISYMFEKCYKLVDLDLSSWNTSKVTNMSRLFFYCTGLTNLNIKTWDTSNATTMYMMFARCRTLIELDVSNFNTSKVTNMGGMFLECALLKEIDVTGFDTSNVTNMTEMFACDAFTHSKMSLERIDVSNFDTSKVTDMSEMFGKCILLKEIDVSNFDTSNVINMYRMFYYCEKLENIDVSNFNTSNVKDMSYMFNNCSSLTSLDVSNFKTSNVTDIGWMFTRCGKLTSLDVSGFDTSKVKDISGMFNWCTSLLELDVSGFVTSEVTDMQSIFTNCKKLKEIDVSKWNTSKVTDMSSMFYLCTSLTEINVSNFDTSNVTDMYGMFFNCNQMQVLDLSNFVTSKVKDIRSMFGNCERLKILDLSNADFNSVTDNINMFYSVPSTITIYVKDEAAKTFILNQKSTANVIIGTTVAYNEEKQLSLASTC